MACLDDPNMTPASAARWELALVDAGLSDGQDAVLHVFDGVNEPSAPGGMAVEPGECAWDVAGTRFSFLPQQADRSFASRDVYEILTYSGFSDRVQLALFRHELEHVRQRRQSLFLLRSSAAIEGGLLEHLPPMVARSLYIAMPTERAAARLDVGLPSRRSAPRSRRKWAVDMTFFFSGLMMRLTTRSSAGACWRT